MTHTQTACPNRIDRRAGKKEARPAEVGALVPKISYRVQTKITKMQTHNANSYIQR